MAEPVPASGWPPRGRQWRESVKKPILFPAIALTCLFVCVQCTTPRYALQTEDVASLFQPAGPPAGPPEPDIRFSGEKVSLQCSQAPLDVVVHKIIEHFGYSLSAPNKLSGRVTVNLKEFDVMRALRLILEGNQYTLEPGDDLLVIRRAPVEGRITREIRLHYLNASTIGKSLSGTYHSSDLKFTPVSEHNALIISGDAEAVSQMEDTIGRLDQPSPSILLEIVLVEINKGRFDEFGLTLMDLASKRLAIQEVNANGSFGDTVSNFEIKEGGPDALPQNLVFKANLKAIRQVGLGKIVTHPHVVCRSGEKAVVEVSLDNYLYVRHLDESSMNVYYKTEKIKAGVKLEVTPTITNSGLILIDFVAEEGNVTTPFPNSAFSIDRNSLNSSLFARDGEVLVVGGLVQRLTETQRSGVPFLSKIPVLNLLFGRHAFEEEAREIVFYVIPRKYHHDYRSPGTTENRGGKDEAR